VPYQTIQLASCVSVQGEFVEILADGQVVIRVGEKEYRGHPIARRCGPRRLPLEVVAAVELARRAR
jgi:hypothetical protein